MTNCTVSGNTANQNAGGIYVVSSSALTNVTIRIIAPITTIPAAALAADWGTRAAASYFTTR